MSADISAARGSSAAETAEALSAADGLDLSIDGWYVTLGFTDSAARLASQGTDTLHHGFRVSLGRDGGEHEVGLRRRGYAIPEVRACHYAPATGWLVWPGRAEPDGDAGDRTVRPGRGGVGLDEHRPLVVIGDVEHRLVCLGVDQFAGGHPALIEEQAVDAGAGEDPQEVGAVDRGGLRLAGVRRPRL